jgi:uncharacterized protein
LNERDLENWDLDIVIGRKPLIEGHMYSFLSRILAQLKLYAIQSSPKLLGQTAKVFDFLINNDGMVITGGAGQIEIWDDSQDGSDFLAESCATAYFMRVCNQLVQLTGDSFFGDLMERTLYNSLFGAWSPECAFTRYFTPFEGERVYSKKASYCCSNNLRRILPALPGMVYYVGSSSLAVNFYVESEAEASIDGNKVKIQQLTDYPASGNVKIRLSPESERAFNLMLRIPKWNKKAEILVNGERIEAATVSGQFFILNRLWKSGDEVEIRFEMQPRLIRGVKKQAGRAALMFGPQIYCLNPGNAGELSNLETTTLGQITLNPASIKRINDNSFHNNDTAVEVEIWTPGDWRTLPKGLSKIKLTEFADPKGTAIYFRLQDISISVPDELFQMKLFDRGKLLE